MIVRLITWSIGNRMIVLLLACALIVGGLWAARTIPVDAIPDLSDVQVIVRTQYAGQSPQIVEDQVTYPLSSAMLAVPRTKAVRGQSWYGTSLVYIVFEDGTDIYWARSRVLEQLSVAGARLPAGVTPQLGPDATGVGWVYEYVLVTGDWCPEHPNGFWLDAKSNRWYGSPGEASDPSQLQRVRALPHSVKHCPIDRQPLKSSELDLSRMRSIQDWQLRFALTALEGVSEVASVGGFVKQYQVVVDPVRLHAHGVTLDEVGSAIRRSNAETGGGVLQLSEMEYMVRGLGYLGSLSDQETAMARESGQPLDETRTRKVIDELKATVIKTVAGGTPIYLWNVAEVRIGPEMRRGIAEWNGQGETVGGIVVMRDGENARAVIGRVQQKLRELESSLPPGLAIDTAYDRSDLIGRSMTTLTHTLVEEIVVVALVCILFLLHARSELVAVFVVPTGVLASLLVMKLLGMNANIMSLGGIAIAIGVMVDSSIIMVENAHKHLDREGERLENLKAAGLPADARPRSHVIMEAAIEVGPSLFFSLLIITVSFLPVFVLGEQSGRLFKPLAYTKTFAMAWASFLAVTIIPVLMTLLITDKVLPRHWGWRRSMGLTCGVMAIPAILLSGMPLEKFEGYRLWLVLGWLVLSGMILIPQRIIHENANPISRLLQWIYEPCFDLAMRLKWLTLAVSLAMVVSIAWPLGKLGSEFMPPLEEGDLLYMPTTDPGISMGKARELIQQTDKLIASFPEVKSVMGKIGAAETATDPAPPSMVETIVVLHRDPARWRHVPIDRVFQSWPDWIRDPLSRVWPLSRPISQKELVNGYEFPNREGESHRVPGLNEVLQVPGLTNSWTQPIRTRIDMLATGIKTPVGVKVLGDDLGMLSEIATDIANTLRTDESLGSATLSAFAEKNLGGNYLDIRIDRQAIARHGLRIADVHDVIATAVGGMNITWTIEGLERYPVSLRYPHELRDNIPVIRRTLVSTPSGAHVPLEQLADFEIRKGPDMVKSENARRTAWVYVDIAGMDLGSYVQQARKVISSKVAIPSGYTIEWSGQYEYLEQARDRLKVIVPATGVLIVLLLYLATRSWLRVLIVMLAVPFSLVGAIWLVWLLDYQLSLAVWVGMIALAGLDAETGLVMLLYLDKSFDRFKSEGRMSTPSDLRAAIHDGAVMRIRPKTMTVVTTFIGLLPLMWAEGAGADTMRRLAAPMIGGLATSFIGELLVYPALYYLAKRTSVVGSA